MSKNPNIKTCTLLTDEEALPGGCDFHSIPHSLLADWSMENIEGMGIQLVMTTPDNFWDVADETRVMIDRILRYTDEVRKIHEAMEERGIPYVNDPTLMGITSSKLQMHEILKDTGIMIAETILIKSFDDLRHFANQRMGEKIVLKPEYGSDGVDIYFIEVLGEDNVHIIWVEDKEGERKEKEYKGSLKRFFDENIVDKGKFGDKFTWVTQDFIELIKCGGCTVDLRMVEQRDGEGELRFTSAYARKAKGSVPLCNLGQGGKPLQIEKVLQETGVKIHGLREFCRAADHEIEKHAKIGEIGHDIGITMQDRSPSLCYIEGNSMPGYTFQEWESIRQGNASLSRSDEKLITMPLQYAAFLAHQKG
jgi:hypothetical protein